MRPQPLSRWSYGRITLLGDAAHPMYPNGANGAGQAILDAASLAAHLAQHRDPVTGLSNYDAERHPATATVVRPNRRGATEHVIELADQLAPDGFDHVDDVIAPDEIDRILTTYTRAAGFTPNHVNSERPMGHGARNSG